MIYALTEVVLPVFSVVVAGYLSRKARFFTNAEIQALLRFAQTVAIPLFLFVTMLNLDIGAVFNWKLLASFYFASIGCFVVGFMVFKILLHVPNLESIALSFCILFSNAVLLGLPITELAYGSNHLGPNLAIIAINAPICYLIGISSMEILGRTKIQFKEICSNILSTLLSNPIAVSIIIGVFFNLFEVTLLEPIQASLSLLSKGAIPLALFGLGGTLVKYKIAKDLHKLAVVLVLSLLIHPVSTYYLGVNIFLLQTAEIRSATITAAMAPGINAFIFANLYKKEMELAASSILIGTPISIFLTIAWISII